MTTLSAVPLPQRPLTFRERGMAALETHQGGDLVAYLAMLHDQDIAEVTEQAVSARNAVVEVSASAAIDQQMLASVMETIRPMLRRSGENSARAAHYYGQIRSLRSLLREAEANGEAITAQAVLDVLNTHAAPPVFRPMVVGFVPSTMYRVGHFRHVQTNVEWHLPFVGFSQCEESAERPMTVHVAFLHNGVVRARPQLYAEHGLVMEHME